MPNSQLPTPKKPVYGKTPNLAVGSWELGVGSWALGVGRWALGLGRWASTSDRRQLFGLTHVTARLRVADELTAVLLRDLLDEERRAAIGALLRDRAVPQREVAVGIIGAAEEHLAAARLALDDVAAVLRAEHAGRLLLDVLARRVAGAGGELAE